MLLEGVPGLGKTLLVARSPPPVAASFSRIQFTPDLMPARHHRHRHLRCADRARPCSIPRGPVFTQLLLADEINRAPPKTQAALLEAMQERQVTVDGTHASAAGRRSS